MRKLCQCFVKRDRHRQLFKSVKHYKLYKSVIPGTQLCDPPEPAPPFPPAERPLHGKWRAAGKPLPPKEHDNFTWLTLWFTVKGLQPEIQTLLENNWMCIKRTFKQKDVYLTFCSHRSFRSSLCGELPTPHWASSTSSWLMCPPWWLSITAAESTVSSFTLSMHISAAS